MAHAALILLVGIAVTHSRSELQPPTLQVIRLDVDLPTPVATDNTLATPSASPVESAVPQVSAPPRPALSIQNEERLLPAAAPQDATPAAPDSIEPLTSSDGVVTTYVATESTTKNIFATGAAGVLAAAPTGPTGPAKTSGNGIGIEGPVSLHSGMKPVYPISARQRGEEGTVVIETTVTPGGRAAGVSVISSSSFADLDRAAMKAVEHAIFNPATEDGRTVEARARITIIFRLTN